MQGAKQPLARGADDQHTDRGERQPSQESAQLETASDALIIRANGVRGRGGRIRKNCQITYPQY
jgi:hypothetical protein